MIEKLQLQANIVSINTASNEIKHTHIETFEICQYICQWPGHIINMIFFIYKYNRVGLSDVEFSGWQLLINGVTMKISSSYHFMLICQQKSLEYLNKSRIQNFIQISRGNASLTFKIRFKASILCAYDRKVNNSKKI